MVIRKGGPNLEFPKGQKENLSKKHKKKLCPNFVQGVQNLTFWTTENLSKICPKFFFSKNQARK